MFGIGPMELMAILVVALLVFGPKRIPELARTLGRGLAEFRRASNDLRQSLALDELQRDLRKDLDPNQTIHRPGDRPAQAGDDDELPKKSSDESDEAVAKEAPADSAAASDRQPGELPAGDEHDYEHRDASDVGDVGDVGDGHDESLADERSPKKQPADASAATEDAKADAVTSAPTSSEPSARHENHPADSELGNVPISGTKPADSPRG
jgi:TatA/E family protein of Tat protein translocase